MLETVMFYTLGGATLLFAICVILFSNPIFSALSLALTMVGAATLFFTLGAYFVAGVQLIVYAGAVMVMFVMVVMLVDLKTEKNPFSKGTISTFLKVFGSVFIGATIMTATAATMIKTTTVLGAGPVGLESTRQLANLLFTKYLFGFEAIGVLLLVVLVGAIALARARGGTHHA